MGAFWAWIRDNFDRPPSGPTWSGCASAGPGPIILKGVLDPEDARLAVAAGVDGIIVQPRRPQLDAAPASIRALPRVVEAVDGRTKVLMDGGVRSGADVLKALALGADACLIGRPWAWALAAEGETRRGAPAGGDAS